MKELKVRQICLFFIAFVPVIKIFSMPSTVAGTVNNDLWISALINFTLDGITLSFLLYSCKKFDTDIYGLLEKNFGKNIAKVIMALYLIYFLLKAILPIAEEKDYVEISLYETPPTFLTFLPFFIVSGYISIKNLRVLGRIADVLAFITAIGMILLIVLSVSSADLSNIFPIGVNGFNKISLGSYKALTWYGDSLYLMFIMGRYKKEKKEMLKISTSFFIPHVFVTAFVILFYAIFSSIAFRQTYALTEISKYSTVINQTERFDFIAIFLILFSGIFSLTLPIYFAVEILTYLLDLKNKIIPTLVINGLYVIIFIFFRGYFYTIENFILNYAGVFFLIMGNILPMFTVLLKNKGGLCSTEK